MDKVATKQAWEAAGLPTPRYRVIHRGEPIARLAPAGKPSSATAETSTGHAILDWLAAHPLPVYARRSAEEIDAAIDDGKGSWG